MKKHPSELPLETRIILEYPHGTIGQVPQEYKNLAGTIADLGLENMGYDKEATRLALQAIGTTGINVPGGILRYGPDLRYNIEPTENPDPKLPSLPEDWTQYIYALDPETGEPRWIGSKIRKDQDPRTHKI